MKKLAFLLLLAITACASGSTVRVPSSNDAARRAEIRIENNNWSEARVYLLLGSGVSGRRRIATVFANGKETAFLRLISPTFRFYVTLLAEQNSWVSEEWNDRHNCFSIVIHNYLAFTYVIPCRQERE